MDNGSDKRAKAPAAVTRFVPWAALGIALLLSILQAALTLPSGYGIEDFLGFTDSNAIGAARAKWAGDPLLLAYGIAYLAIDLALFIPLYVATSLRVGYWLNRRLQGTDAKKFRGRHLLVQVAAYSTAVLVPIDLVETTIGLLKLGAPIWGFGSAVFGIVIVVFGMRFDVIQRSDHKPLLIAASISLLVVVLASLVGRDWLGCGGGEWLNGWGCVAHRAKQYPIALMFLAPIAGVLLWLSGLQAEAEEKALRAELRAAIGDIVVRSRYVLLILLLLTLLLFFGGQSRDILVGMLTDTKGDHPALTLVAIFVSLVALWTLSHSCWLWTRVVCRVPGPLRAARASRELTQSQAETERADNVRSRDSESPNRYIEAFAKYWARSAGVAPLLIFAWLASLTLHDLVVARANEGAGKMLVAAVAGLVLGALFIIRREAAGRREAKEKGTQERYFDDPAVVGSDGLRLTDSHWDGPRYGFWLFFKRAPVWLPIVSLAAMIVCRLPSSLALFGWPPLAFASLLFAASAWMGLFGWLWLVERRQSVPWVLLLIAAVGVLDSCQLTDNHVVWTYEQHRGSDAAWPMWLATAALAGLLGTAGWWATTRSPAAKVWCRVRVLGGLVLLVFGLLLAANRLTSGPSAEHQAQSDGAAIASTPRDPRGPVPAVTLDEALAQWLRALWLKQKAAKSEGDLPVYFVATEGGGARAAYWTALVLLELDRQDPSFVERSFAISGVSGGSVGAAAFIACRRYSSDAGTCIERLGQIDLVSPLLGAFLFEDIVARIVPTSVCGTPGCGFLSRGVWFERVLQGAVPEMKHGLRGSRPGVNLSASERAAAKPPDHLPYLFLNSTWVESGERAIASEVRITKDKLPTARDEIDIVGDDLTMATAAHNSARFPVVNSIGSVRTAATNCPGGADTSDRVVCGHMADGGYFDNSGSHTIIDILHALRDFLAGEAPSSDKMSADEARQIRAWAQRSLRPEVLFIHNGIALKCDRPKGVHQPNESEVACVGTPGHFEPQAPVSGEPVKVYADVLGIAKTVVNVTGLGSNRRRADSLLIDEIQQLRGAMMEGQAGAEEKAGRKGAKALSDSQNDVGETQKEQKVTGYLYRCFEQTNNGVLYPLGWYLSFTARTGMQEQVGNAVKKPGCAMRGVEPFAGEPPTRFN